MSKTNDKMVRALLFTQECMIVALVETHPDPERLLNHFRAISDKLVGISSGEGCDDAFLDLISAQQRSYESRLAELIKSK